MSALRNAAAVLRCFTTEKPELSVSDVVDLLEIPKSTASWLLKIMAEEGLLEVSGATRRYRPGTVVIASGQLFRATSSLVSVVNEFVGGLASETGHTGYISVLDGRDVLAIRMHPGSHALRVVTPIGLRLPAFATATGRSLLARTPDPGLRDLLPLILTPVSGHAPKTLDDLLQRLESVRRQGFAEADDEANRGVGSIAVSLADPAELETVSACISFSLSIVSDAERDAMRSKLVSGASEIGRRFNDPFWTARAAPPNRSQTTAA